MSNRLERPVAVISGILAATLALEGILRVFATPGPTPVPHAARDAFDAPVVVTRQMEEGIASARFTIAGARLTGNAPIPHAPVIVLLGDSYVVAREVQDEETMGSRIEDRARSEKIGLNVRQYGWRGASAAQYLDVAREVLRRWSPSQVVVVLDEGDLGADALNRKFPRMAIGADDEVTLIHSPDGPGAARTGILAPQRSALGGLIRVRWQRILGRAPRLVQRWGGAELESRGPTPDSASLAAVPRATVKALARAFGPDLAIVYAADVRVNFGHARENGETALLRACANLKARCASTRDAMLAARARGVIVRGFPTTTLGVGHLNSAGHELIAREIWKLVRPALVPGAAPQMAAR